MSKVLLQLQHLNKQQAKKIRELLDEKERLTHELAESKKAFENLLDAFISLREAIDAEGYDVYVNGERKPIYEEEQRLAIAS